MRSKVQFLPGPQHLKFLGAVAQLGEHLLCKQGVVGSNPISSNITCAKYVASNLKFFENQITYIQSSLVRLRKLDSNLNKKAIIRWVAKGMKIYFRKAKRLYI